MAMISFRGIVSSHTITDYSMWQAFWILRSLAPHATCSASKHAFHAPFLHTARFSFQNVGPSSYHFRASTHRSRFASSSRQRRMMVRSQWHAWVACCIPSASIARGSWTMDIIIHRSGDDTRLDNEKHRPSETRDGDRRHACQHPPRSRAGHHEGGCRRINEPLLFPPNAHLESLASKVPSSGVRMTPVSRHTVTSFTSGVRSEKLFNSVPTSRFRLKPNPSTKRRP
ncbi:hypothetical protein OG21DRAFT_1516825 [Imleria badia]|nr:hypothetical protein OG21DRAFT_1516825 [Imleria badia]